MQRAAFTFMLMICCSGAASAETFSSDISAFTKWARVVRAEHVKPRTNDEGVDVQALLHAEIERLKSIRYAADKDDHWATRAETRKRGAGDCEDFAIAAYFDLLETGVPDEELHIVVAQDRRTGEIHAYLQVYSLVLDHRTVGQVLTEGEAADKYRPVYAINRLGWLKLDNNGARS